jgi:hypothetical protein
MTRCIFWEPNTPHTRLSREHIWGKWLKAYVQSTMKKHHMQGEVVGRPGTPISIKSTIRAGDPLKSKIKIVCEACNNGWMSRIQQRAKPFLIPLIEGSTSVLGTVAQKAIATWCVMATMTAEYLTHDLTSIAISQADRDWFRDHGSPPENWRFGSGDTTATEVNGHTSLSRSYPEVRQTPLMIVVRPPIHRQRPSSSVGCWYM